MSQQVEGESEDGAYIYGFYKPSLLLLVLIVLSENLDNISKEASISGAYLRVCINAYMCIRLGAMSIGSLAT